jgi:hypothetical protein
LNKQGHDLQMDMWNKTNYGAQVKHMLEAGLNPALMYGSAGQGGTTGSQGGGSAAGGSAVGENVMDMQNMLLGKQLEKIDSEIDLNESKAGLNAIQTALETHDYNWLKENDLSRQSQTLVKGIADITGDNFSEILGAIDDRVDQILEVYKNPGEALKNKAKAVEQAVKESAKAHGVLIDKAKDKGKDIIKGIKKGYDNWKNKNNN